MKSTFLTIFLLVIFKLSYSQQSDISRVNLVPIAINSAYVGSYDQLKVGYYRSEYLIGSVGSPIHNAINFDLPLLNSNNGLGIYYSNYKVGDINQNFINMGYSYKFIFKGFKLQLGSGLTYKRYKAEYDNYAVVDSKTLTNGEKDILDRFVINTGLFLYKDKYYLSVSYNDMLLYSSEDEMNYKGRNLNIISGYHFFKGRSVSICPSFLFKTFNESSKLYGVNLTSTIKNTFWFGLTYDNYEQFNLSLGINIWQCYASFRYRDALNDFDDFGRNQIEFSTGFYFNNK